MNTTAIRIQAQREEAQITAVALFGLLTEGDRRERSLIHGILTEATRAQQPAIYRLAAELLRYQDREDPLHALGHAAVTAAKQERPQT